MGIKYSTGRGARVKHSTALEWDDLEKAKKKYSPIKYSTGEKASVRHATGVEFDYKYLVEKEKDKKSIRSKARSKAKTEGDDYLEKFHESIRKERRK